MITSSTKFCKSLGETPGMRAAWAKDGGRTRSNFWRASVLKEYFGKAFVEIFATMKEVEADRFGAEPTERDFEWYLRTV